MKQVKQIGNNSNQAKAMLNSIQEPLRNLTPADVLPFAEINRKNLIETFGLEEAERIIELSKKQVITKKAIEL